jgi:hypothetical protein
MRNKCKHFDRETSRKEGTEEKLHVDEWIILNWIF